MNSAQLKTAIAAAINEAPLAYPGGTSGKRWISDVWASKEEIWAAYQAGIVVLSRCDLASIHDSAEGQGRWRHGSPPRCALSSQCYTLLMNNAIKVGDAVQVRHYADVPGGLETWTDGYKVRAVEFEDFVVEKDGQAFAIGSLRVRVAQ